MSKAVSAKLFTFSVGECETVPVVETLRRSIGCADLFHRVLWSHHLSLMNILSLSLSYHTHFYGNNVSLLRLTLKLRHVLKLLPLRSVLKTAYLYNISTDRP